MKYNRLILLFLCACMSFSCGAQYFNKRETLHSFVCTSTGVIESDSDFFVTSTSIDSTNDLGGGLLLPIVGIRLSKFSKEGKIAYDSFYQKAGINFYCGNNSVLKLKDGKILIPGNSLDTSGPAKLALLCFDTLGKIEWIKRYNKPFCTIIQLDADYWVLNDLKSDGYGNWILLSTFQCGVKFKWAYTKMLLTKLDSNFNLVWHKPFGDEIYNSRGGHLIIEPSGYAFCGTYTNENFVNKDYTYRSEIIRTDTSGNETWHWISPSGRPLQKALDIIRTADGGYVYCGQGDGYQVLSKSGEFSSTYWYPTVDKIDSIGNPIWHQKLLNYSCDADQSQINVLRILPNGDIMAAGNLIAGYDTSTIGGSTYGHLVKIAPDGTVKWRRLYTYQGDSMIYTISDMKPTSDGGFVMAGQALDTYWPYAYPIQQAWLLKVDSNGCNSETDPQCWPTAVPKVVVKEGKFLVYPNPASGKITISYIGISNATMLLFDLAGRQLLSLPLSTGAQEVQADVSSFSRGLYFYKILGAEGVLQQGKLVLE